MANPIGYNDFFNFGNGSEVQQAIKLVSELRNAYQDFLTTVAGDQLTKLDAQQKAVAESARLIADATKALNATSDAEQKKLLQLASAMESVNKQYQVNAQSGNALKNIKKSIGDSVDGLTQKLKEQVLAYNKLSQSYNSQDAFDRQAAKIRQTKEEISNLTNALKVNASTYRQASGSYNQLDQETKKLIRDLKALEGGMGGNTREAKQMAAQIRENTEKLKQFDSAMGHNFRNVGNYASAMGNLNSSLSSLALRFISITALTAGFNKIIETVKIYDSLNTSLKVVTGTAEEYDSVQRFLSVNADKYGKDLITLSETYKGLAGATRDTKVEGDATRKVFLAVVQASTALKLSNDDVRGSLLAIQQMFSKGTVQAEELRGQLGDRLPGAFRLFAESIGVSERELNKLLKTNQVLAVDALPKFAQKLSEVYSEDAIKASEALVSNQNRLNVAFQQFMTTFADTTGITTFWTEMNKGLSTFIKDVTFFLSNRDRFGTDAFFMPGKKKGNNLITDEREKIEAVQSYIVDFEGKIPEDRMKLIETQARQLQSLRKGESESLGRQAAATASGNQKQRLAAIEETNIMTYRVQRKQKFIDELKAINQRLLDQEAKVGAIPVEPPPDDGKAKAALKKAIHDADELAKANAKLQIARAEKEFALGERSLQDSIDLENKRLAILEESYRLRLGLYKKDSKEYKLILAEQLDAERANVEKIRSIRDEFLKKGAKKQVQELESEFGDRKGFDSQVEFENRKLEILRKSYDERQALYTKDSEEYIAIAAERADAEADASGRIKKAHDDERKSIREVIDAYDKLLRDEKVDSVRMAEAKKKITPEQADYEIFTIEDEAYKEAIEGKENLLNTFKEKDKEYYDTEAELINLRRERASNEAAYLVKVEKDAADKKMAINQALFDFLSGLANGLNDLGQAITDNQIQHLENQKALQLERAGENAEARAQIEEKFQRKIVEQRRKQAQYDKLFGLFTIGINTAEAVSRSIALSPATFGQPFAGYAIAQGLVQAAIVAARPLPSYEKGRKGGKAEWARINEKGAELIEENGRFRVEAGGKETVTFLREGAKVYTHTETKEILMQRETDDFLASLLKGTGITRSYETEKNNQTTSAIARSFDGERMEKAFERAIEKIPIQQTVFNEQGFTKFWKNKWDRVEDLNSRNKIGGRG